MVPKYSQDSTAGPGSLLTLTIEFVALDTGAIKQFSRFVIHPFQLLVNTLLNVQ